MVLVDPSRIMTEPFPNPLKESVSDLDREMNNVLNSSQNEHEKVKGYQQVLQRYLTRKRQYDGEMFPETIENRKQRYDSEKTTDSTDAFEDRILDVVPPTLQRKARGLINHLKQLAKLKWNEKGEMIYKDQTIRGSNVIDLINDTLRARKSTRSPRGWDVFTEVLKESNVPRELIGNKERWDDIDPVVTTSRSEKKPKPIKSWKKY